MKELLEALGEAQRWAGTHSGDDPYNQHLPWRLFFSAAWLSTAVHFALPEEAHATAPDLPDPVA